MFKDEFNIICNMIRDWGEADDKDQRKDAKKIDAILPVIKDSLINRLYFTAINENGELTCMVGYYSDRQQDAVIEDALSVYLEDYDIVDPAEFIEMFNTTLNQPFKIFRVVGTEINV